MATSLFHFQLNKLFKNMVCIFGIIWFGNCFGYFSKNGIFGRVRPLYERAVSNQDRSMHRSLWVYVAHSLFIEGSHKTKNTASGHPGHLLVVAVGVGVIVFRVGFVSVTDFRSGFE